MIALTSGVAAAQPTGPWGPPTFMTMDRQDGGSHIGFQLGFNFFDDDALGMAEVTSIGTQLYGQYVSPSGFGGYGILPFNYISVEDGPIDESESAIGDIELGALYSILGNQVDWAIHAGVALPTADDELEGTFANGFGTYARITDFVLALPETTTLRFAGSPIFRSGQIVLRADAGLDVPISGPGDDEPDPIFRLNVGGGIDTGSFAILGEFVNSVSTDDDDADDNDWINMFAITGRFRAGTVQPGVALVLPIDDDLNDLLDFVLAVGIQGAI